jgi:hypothetical protein
MVPMRRMGAAGAAAAGADACAFAVAALARVSTNSHPMVCMAAESILTPPPVSLLSFLEWLASTHYSVALHESLFMYPLIESTHVLALTLFVGLAVMLDLRLLGLTLNNVPVSEMLDRVLPWTKAGFVVMIVTGLLLFYAIPVRNYQNIFFRIKVVMLLLAGLNVWLFHSRVERRVADWDLDPVAPKGARVAAVVSIVLWAGIVVAGRMIAYNWFDCDIQPQPDFINWAAGCVVVPQ